MLDAICLTVYSFYDCIKNSKESVKEKYQLARSISEFLRVLEEKQEQELILAFVELLHENNKLPFVPPLVRYVQSYLAFEAYSMITHAAQLPPEMFELNKRIA